MLTEIILLSAFLVYVFLYGFLTHRSHSASVGWTWPLLCMAPAMYIGLTVFGAVYDMSFTVELVNVLKRRMSPWGMKHNFAYLPGYPVLLTPVAWMTQSAAGIAMGAKFLNLGFLIWFGLMAGGSRSLKQRIRNGGAYCIFRVTLYWLPFRSGTVSSRLSL